MTGHESVKSLLVLRRLTRAIADVLRAQLMEHLATLTPLLQPQGVCGEYLQGGRKAPSPKADLAFKELKSPYQTIPPAKPLTLRRELSPPSPFTILSLDITPVDYVHVIQTEAGARNITVRSPLTWT